MNGQGGDVFPGEDEAFLLGGSAKEDALVDYCVSETNFGFRIAYDEDIEAADDEEEPTGDLRKQVTVVGKDLSTNTIEFDSAPRTSHL